jgi:hypothetical protein
MNTLAPARRLLAGTLVLAGLLVGPVQAADTDGAALILREQADGRLVAVQHGSRGLEVVAMRHRADAVASDCIALETRSGPGVRQTPMLRNRCAHEVAVSYCIESDSGSRSSCDAVGVRDLKATRLAAGAALTLSGSATPDAQVNWVACRGDAEAISSLIDGGSRGECLATADDAVIADAQR